MSKSKAEKTLETIQKAEHNRDTDKNRDTLKDFFGPLGFGSDIAYKPPKDPELKEIYNKVYKRTKYIKAKSNRKQRPIKDVMLPQKYKAKIIHVISDAN